MNAKRNAKLTPFLLNDGQDHDTVLLFPGGGYQHVAILKEGLAVAKAWNKEGFNAYVLNYRVRPASGHEILSDAVHAVQEVKASLRQNGSGKCKLAVMGFSAGGHLTLMSQQHWDEITDDPQNVGADALIPCYPVVSFRDPYTHQGSRMNFLGEENANNVELIDKYSAELHIGPDFPPTFVWHCEGDKTVPVENSRMLHDALDKAGVSNKLLIYPNGAHGLGLARRYPEISGWFGEAAAWLKEQFAE